VGFVWSMEYRTSVVRPKCTRTLNRAIKAVLVICSTRRYLSLYSWSTSSGRRGLRWTSRIRSTVLRALSTVRCKSQDIDRNVRCNETSTSGTLVIILAKVTLLSKWTLIVALHCWIDGKDFCSLRDICGDFHFHPERMRTLAWVTPSRGAKFRRERVLDPQGMTTRCDNRYQVLVLVLL